MKNQIIAAVINKYFNFLIKEYGAHVEEDESSIKFINSNFQICIVRYRGDTVLSVAPANAKAEDWLELGDIVTFRRGDNRHNYGMVTSSDDESIVRHYANLVKAFCNEMLNGDFSDAPLIRRYIQEIK